MLSKQSEELVTSVIDVMPNFKERESLLLKRIKRKHVTADRCVARSWLVLSSRIVQF